MVELLPRVSFRSQLPLCTGACLNFDLVHLSRTAKILASEDNASPACLRVCVEVQPKLYHTFQIMFNVLFQLDAVCGSPFDSYIDKRLQFLILHTFAAFGESRTQVD